MFIISLWDTCHIIPWTTSLRQAAEHKIYIIIGKSDANPLLGRCLHSSFGDARREIFSGGSNYQSRFPPYRYPCFWMPDDLRFASRMLHMKAWNQLRQFCLVTCYVPCMTLALEHLANEDCLSVELWIRFFFLCSSSWLSF